MCILFFGLDWHPKFKFIMLANRDELFNRATSYAEYWKDSNDQILAGRDLVRGGTWLAVSPNGRFGAITNIRTDTSVDEVEARRWKSRGVIVTDFIQSDQNAMEFLNELKKDKDQYRGFNVVLGDINLSDIYWYSNQQNEVLKLESGKLYSVSNFQLDTDWVKVKIGKQILTKKRLEFEQISKSSSNSNLCSQSQPLNQDLEQWIDVLKNTEGSSADPKYDLPRILEDEKREWNLNSIFVQPYEDYGTRSHTIVLVSHDKEVLFLERSRQLDSSGCCNPPLLPDWVDHVFQFQLKQNVK